MLKGIALGGIAMVVVGAGAVTGYRTLAQSKVAEVVSLAIAFALRFACQPGSSEAAHWGSVSQSSLTSIDDGVRWKTYSSLHALARWGTHCTAVAPVPMMATRLSASLAIAAPVGAPPG